MPRARRKAPRQEAPQTIEQATQLTARYIALLDQIEIEKAEAQKAVDQIVSIRDELIAPLEEEMKAIFRQMRPWWAANQQELTDGKRKSIELAGAQIGERTTTPALTLPKGTTLGSLVDWLLGRELFGLVRTKHTVDKPACIKALRVLDQPEPNADATDAEVITYQALRGQGELLAEKGVTTSQRDEFFIDRVGENDEAAQLVEVEDEGGAA